MAHQLSGRIIGYAVRGAYMGQEIPKPPKEVAIQLESIRMGCAVEPTEEWALRTLDDPASDNVFHQGWFAERFGKRSSENPYNPPNYHHDARDWWLDGWDAASHTPLSKTV